MIEGVETRGFAVIEKAVSEPLISTLIAETAKIDVSNATKVRNRDIFGIRNLLNVSAAFREFSESKSVRGIIELYLGKRAKAVRAIYFDKTPDTNWKVPWHQDLTIAVRQRIDTHGFTAWSMKAGVHHVQPPTEILKGMVALRFHLDDADETNGALRVLPETHKFGRLDATEIHNLKSKQTVHLCEMKKGSCMLMKPLLLHSSAAGKNPRNRRVIHLEFSSGDLPNGLEWYGT